MATRIAAPGGGNWTAGGTWVGGVAPTAADDAQLTVASGNVTIDAGAVARSLDCTTYVGTLTHGAGVNFNLGDATAGAGNIALKLVAGMTYSQSGNGSIGFVSTSATQQTITTAGKTVVAPNIAGAGSSYVLGDALTANTFALTAGTFNTGNFACSWSALSIVGAGAKTLTLGSSAIAITGSSGSAVDAGAASGVTYTANTAVFTFSGLAAGISGGSWNGTSAVFNSTVSAVTLNATPTLNNVTFNGFASKVVLLTMSSAATITGTFTVASNTTTNRILMRSSVSGTSRTVTVTTGFSFSNVDFQDITAAGAAGTWTGTSMGNALGNSNITFDPAATQTRSGAGGNYSTAGSWTSRVPLPQDNVVIGAGASGTITMDMPRLGADIDFTGFSGTASFASVANSLYGSLNLASGMTVSGTQTLTLAARSSKTITSSGKTFTQAVVIVAVGGTYTLADAFATALDLVFNSGTLTTSNFAVAALTFTATAAGTRVLNGGSSTFTLSRTLAGTIWDIGAAGGTGATTYNGTSVSVLIATASASTRQVNLYGPGYSALTYTVAGSTGALICGVTATIGTINFSDASNARSLLFSAGATYTITTLWNVFGTAGKLMTVDSATAATHTLTKPGGVVSTDFLNVAHSIATGGAGWYAGANSTDGGNNTGWVFHAPPTGDFWFGV